MIDELRQAVSARGTRESARAAWSTALTWGVERARALPILKRLYLDTARRAEPLFADRALAVLDVQTDVIGHIDAIPSAGPLIVVANHPTGALDGLVLAWHHSLGRLVQATGAPVLPCFIDGRNSTLFQLVGLAHARLRTLLRPRESADHTDARSVHSTVLEAVSPAPAPSERGTHLAGVSPESWSAEAREIAPLLATQRLTRSGSFTVLWASAPQAPRLIERIGLEREIAFRAVGEGTGRARDLDAFDDRYLHLCAWDHERNTLVGAYRVGLLDASASPDDCDPRRDRRVAAPSLDLLYTSTLFHFDRRLSKRLSPAMELGRAFVRAPYQKQHAALMALWTGIGRLVLNHPRTRYLFGAVSIGATYSPAARAVMVAFLRRHAMHRSFAALASARTPIPATGLGAHARGHHLELSGEAVRAAAMHLPATPDLDALDTQVRALDREGKGLPVLLRQYLRLGARALAFNIDPAFNHALDVLVVVDLPHAAAALLRRYMGADEARAYRALHGDASDRLHTNTFATSFDHASAH